MNKFVFLNLGEGYQQCIMNAVRGEKSVFCFIPFRYSFVKKLFQWHNMWRLNQIHELPLKRIWHKRCLKGMDIRKDEEIYFLLYESFHMTYSISFLKYLKRTYRRAKLFFVFSNPANKYNLAKLAHVKEYIDYAITFYRHDAQKYGFCYCAEQPFRVPVQVENTMPESDVFFIGADKGRLDKIIKIYEHLTNAGLKCDFHVVDVPVNRQKYSDKIIYNRRIPYTEVLKRVQNTRCVLEILQNDYSYLSIRTIEAMQYHKKLITTSQASIQDHFYHPQIIQIINDFESIDINFITKEANMSCFPGQDFCAFNSFAEFLLSITRR